MNSGYSFKIVYTGEKWKATFIKCSGNIPISLLGCLKGVLEVAEEQTNFYVIPNNHSQLSAFIFLICVLHLCVSSLWNKLHWELCAILAMKIHSFGCLGWTRPSPFVCFSLPCTVPWQEHSHSWSSDRTNTPSFRKRHRLHWRVCFAVCWQFLSLTLGRTKPLTAPLPCPWMC